MYKVGDLVKSYKISRSTLLYYDKISLLKPSGRSHSNYRLYTQSDFDRLAQISLYKDAGLALDSIAEILNSSSTNASQILEKRLDNLNKEMGRIRTQQQLIIELLGNDALLRSTKLMNKEQWVNILKGTGLDEDDMRQWHIEFERELPEVHTDFLESLGIESEEIKQIKSWSISGSNE